MNAILSKELLKKIRTAAQIIFLALGIVFFVQLFWERYTPPVFDRENWTQRDGFMAISYNSMTREVVEGLNSRQQFKEHLEALTEAGFNWITAKDIVDFYENNKPLPEKALYLMLEGGRKDNVIWGQPVMAGIGAHAGFYTYTGTLSNWSNFFITLSQAATLAQNPFWDLGSQGERPLKINENLPGVEPADFLCDFLRSPNGRQIENNDAMFKRFEKYYINASAPIARFLDGLPAMYIMNPANSFNTLMPDAIELANFKLMKKYFQAAFTKVGPPFNSALDNIYGLSRMQVKSDWTASRLIQMLDKGRFDRTFFTMDTPDCVDDWTSFRTKIQVEDNSIILEPQEGHIDPVILTGSNLWENVSFSFTLTKREPFDRYVYLRYVSRDSYIRMQIKFNRLLIQERLPNQGLYTIFDSVIRTPPPWRFNTQVLGNRIRASIGDVLISDDLPISPWLIRGAVALGTAPEKDIRAAFTDIKAERLPVIWRIEQGGALPTDASPMGLVCASILPLDHTGYNVRQLLRARSLGMMAIAALPEGQISFTAEDLAVPSLALETAVRMWNGVMVTPEPNVNWSELNKTFDQISQIGKYPVLRLSREAAINLADSGSTMVAGYYILDFKKSDIPADKWITLAHRQNKNFFLYRIEDSEQKNLYTAER